LNHKLKSSALFFTIVISLVVALLCSSLILIGYFSRLQIQQNQQKERLARNLRSAIQLLVSESVVDSSLTLDLYGEAKDSIIIGTHQWGIYEVGYASSFGRGDTVSSTFMLGVKPDSIYKSALYLLDQGRPVTFAGNTLVKGIAYLPEAGAKRGWVDGKNFEREKMVEGETRKSESRLPELNKAFLQKMLKAIDFKGKGIYNLPLPKDSLKVSFFQKTMRFHRSRSPLFLNSISAKGNVIFSSDTLIVIGSNAHLENVILFAPNIEFAEGFKGKVQAFATDSIIVGKDCHFQFPSALCLLEIDSIDNRPRLHLAKGVRLEGSLLQYVTFLDRSLATTTISSDAIVEGVVYADALVSIEGSIFGSLICNKFLLNRPSGVYENHLLDCTLDRTKLSKYFLMSPLFLDKNKDIVSWME
jgi:hypothetical protein